MTNTPTPPWQNVSSSLAPLETEWRERIEALYQTARAAGLAYDVDVYADCYQTFFAQLDELDRLLNSRRFLLAGDAPTVVDEWMATLLVRFELVFHGLYKLNRQRLEEFSNLAHYLRDVIAATACIDAGTFAEIRRTYYLEDTRINPLQRIPLGALDLDAPHDRELRFGRDTGASDRDEDQQKTRLDGEWVRKQSGHRALIGDNATQYTVEPGRYHLYIANNCPWSHRAALARSLKGLDDVISMDVLFYTRDPERGWQFRGSEPGCTADSVNGSRYISEVYARAGSDEKSVPVLWDRKTHTIVSNESAEIIRMFDRAFGHLGTTEFALYPDEISAQIDRINAFTYHAINNGAYKAGFASGQPAYEDAYARFFEALACIEHMLRGRRFLLGEHLTEADLRLFPTIFRFDAVYYTRFNLNQRMVRDMPSIQGWLQRMFEIPAVARASNLEHCRKGYFGRSGNNIVPLGPQDRFA